MQSIALVSDAYGGRGGIALYNRNFLRALCAYPDMDKVIAVPRSVAYDLEDMPPNLSFITTAVDSKLKYLIECLQLALFEKRVDLIICGHLHLLPFAYLLKLRHRCPIIPLTYGVEAWTPTPYRTVNFLCRKFDCFISIRKMTAQKLNQWSGRRNRKYYYLPNCIDETKYGLAPKRTDLVNRYGIKDKHVIITAGRLDSGEIDRNKGFDEVLEILPALRKEIPDVKYLIMGDGEDKSRLEEKAKNLSVEDIVEFTGYITDCEKADYFRLADVFAMPGSNKIFDRYPFRFVFLEVLACGVPVVGCLVEDDSEKDDPDVKKLIIQTDPNDKKDIKLKIMHAFKRPKEIRPEINNYFYTKFQERVHKIIKDTLLMHRLEN